MFRRQNPRTHRLYTPASASALPRTTRPGFIRRVLLAALAHTGGSSTTAASSADLDAWHQD